MEEKNCFYLDFVADIVIVAIARFFRCASRGCHMNVIDFFKCKRIVGTKMRFMMIVLNNAHVLMPAKLRQEFN